MAIAATGALIAIPAGTAMAATGTQVAYTQYGYPYPNATDCPEYAGQAGTCTPDAWSFYQGQCVSWVAYRLRQLNGVPFQNFYRQPSGQRWGSAQYWGAAADRAGIARNGSPALGAVAWYSFGHVAYVESVVSSTDVVISEMNFDDHNAFRLRHVYAGQSGWPTQFIHVADRSGSAPGPTAPSGSSPASHSAGDFNGDGKADFTVFDRAAGTWRTYINNPGGDPAWTWADWGVGVPMPGDYNGDGRTDFTTYDPGAGTWRTYLNNPGGDPGAPWADWSGGVPVAGDFNGDGKADYTIYDPSNGTWKPYINAADHGWTWANWGGPGFIPVSGDFNGDGRADFTVYSPSTGEWRPFINNPGGDSGWPWATVGGPGWIPVPADYNGDGKTDFAAYEPTTGQWKVAYSGAAGGQDETWGGVGFLPAPADVDGDGRADFTVYNPGSGEWRPYLNHPGGDHGYTWTTWGGPSMFPVLPSMNTLWWRQSYPPTAVLGVTVSEHVVNVSSAGAQDAFGRSLDTASFDYGDGSTSSGATGSHTYASDGDYTVTETVTDVLGATSSTTRTVHIGTSAPPGLTLSTSAINVGQAAALTVSGKPGTEVDLLASSQPDTTYTLVRHGTITSSGTLQLSVAPRTNTKLYARSAQGDSPVKLLSVRPAESLKARNGGRTVTFSGQLVPGHGGVTVRVYSVYQGRLTLLGTTTTDVSGAWQCTRTLSSAGTKSFISQTTSDATSLSGQSNRVSLTLP